MCVYVCVCVCLFKNALSPLCFPFQRPLSLLLARLSFPLLPSNIRQKSPIVISRSDRHRWWMDEKQSEREKERAEEEGDGNRYFEKTTGFSQNSVRRVRSVGRWKMINVSGSKLTR